jgi:curved DNA-binding protein CbpA
LVKRGEGRFSERYVFSIMDPLVITMVIKNYYKILGVKETAFEEEIRNRWIELTKQCHPDLRKGSKVNEKIKEINEAYQTLKLSSSRMEYDLKRKYDRKKKKLNVRRAIFPLSILIVLFIIASLFFIRFRSPSPSSLKTSSDESPLIASLTPNRKGEINRRDEKKERNQNNRINRGDLRSRTLSEGTTSAPPSKAKTSVKVGEVVSKEKSKFVPQEIVKVVSEPTPTSSLVVPQTARIQKLYDPIDRATQRPDDPPTQISYDAPTPKPYDAIESKTQRPHDTLTQRPAGSVVPVISKPDIAKEEEVSRFFNNYIERYTRKDVDGFLSFFSLKAIQNQKFGFEEIRKIYANFFNRSLELRYHIRDMKIEIYENVVEVKARYEVSQRLKKGEEKAWRGNIRWVLIREDGVLKILSLDYQQEKSS